MERTLEWERRFGYPRVEVGGVDEVGRGCLAGPVVAACVVLPEVPDGKLDPALEWLLEIQDSKKLTEKKREELCPKIMGWAKRVSVQSASVEEIDEINIFQASLLAMSRAVRETAPGFVLVDGKFLPKDLICAGHALIKGDSLSLAIASASIVAKVFRDRLMQEMDVRYPEYGLKKHKGYPTPIHQAALKRHGVTPIHRRTFGPVQEVLRQGE